MPYAPMGASTTIFALASGNPPAAIAVMRLSGPRTDAIVAALAGALPSPRHAGLRTLRHGGEILDRGLVLRFPGPNSYTGEDSAELHLHAGPAVIEGVAQALLDLGAQPAEPGEFTRRACLAGRIGLLEAEAVGDLVEAETQSQRRQALDQLGGELTALYDQWAVRLRSLLAHQEALIDFPDEDLPPEVETAVLTALDTLLDEMQTHLSDGIRGERVRSGVSIVIAGPPNVGKSSLLNTLAGEDAAIVSPIAGTTRDAVSVRMQLGGVLVTLTDTAGLRETADAIEAEGVRRAGDRAARADLVIVLAGPGQAPLDVRSAGEVWVVRTKADLDAGPFTELAISTLTGAGIDELQRRLAAMAQRLTARSAAAPLTRARHRAGIEAAAAALREARAETWPEMRGEALRLAMQALGRLTGRVGVEDLLDTVFSQFCIGK